MIRIYLFIAASILAFLGTQSHAQTTGNSSAQSVRATLDRYCVTCHNETLKTAGLMLDQANVFAPENNQALWEKVIRKLRMRAMPPPPMPRPDEAVYQQVIGY
ncbi:MAG: hypothetical protein GTO60_12875, partial [Gammaproteobacteria bacterium]|nr:hypothetical protein [Gammaproteobacteria bacterium]